MRSFQLLYVVAYAFVSVVVAGCGGDELSNTPVTAAIKPALNPATAGAPILLPDGTPQNPSFPRVKIATSVGDIVIELDAEKAPITVKNFLWYTSNAHYDGTIFHQVFSDYMVLGSGYSEALEEKPTQFWIRNEADNGLENVRGSIAMARRPDRVDSSTCQFFFNLTDNPHLNHKARDSAEEYGYCVFVRVVDGIEVLDRIGKVPVADKDTFVSLPDPPVVIKSVALLR